MIFATTIAPILDSVATVIMTGLEAIKGKCAVKVAEYNDQISRIGTEEAPVVAVGFQIPTEEDDYGED